MCSVGSPGDCAEILAHWVLVFGTPRDSIVSFDPKASLFRAILLYGNFGFTVEVVYTPSLPAPTLQGSVACPRGMMEFRLASERLLSYSPAEGVVLRLALPEGDAEYYRDQDLIGPEAQRLVPAAVDQAAVVFARGLVGRGG